MPIAVAEPAETGPVKKLFPNAGDYVKLTCQVHGHPKIYYAKVSDD